MTAAPPVRKKSVLTKLGRFGAAMAVINDPVKPKLLVGSPHASVNSVELSGATDIVDLP